MSGPELVFSAETWNLLVTYGRMPADAPGLSAPGHTRVTWSALTPLERGQLYRSLVRCASRAPSRALRCQASDQLMKLKEWVAADPAGTVASDAVPTGDSSDAANMP